METQKKQTKLGGLSPACLKWFPQTNSQIHILDTKRTRNVRKVNFNKPHPCRNNRQSEPQNIKASKERTMLSQTQCLMLPVLGIREAEAGVALDPGTRLARAKWEDLVLSNKQTS